MPLIEVFTCARCGVTRQKSNHWLIAIPAGTIGLAGIEFHTWDDKSARRPEAVHLCGESCAMKELSAFMNTSRSLANGTSAGQGPVPAPPEANRPE